MAPDFANLPRRPASRTVGPRLRLWLAALLGLSALLGANSLYLGSMTLLGWIQHRFLGRSVSYENYFYQYMFLAHLVLGLIVVVPLAVFGVGHWLAARGRKNRRATRIGYVLLWGCVAVAVTGLLLMRIEGFEITGPTVRSALYWAHVICPVLAAWAYVLHRLAGPRIRWRVGLGWTVASVALVGGMVLFHVRDPREWGRAGPAEGTNYFHPSLARTATGKFIPDRTLMMDDYCRRCHQDAFTGWHASAHHFSSFNNPPYLASVKETRKVALERDGTVKPSRWCAGCHDVVPFLSGAFDNPHFDLEKDPTGQAGITCTVCHAITHVNTTRGNADYTIEEPLHYPFAFSSNSLLQFVNRQLIRAKPEFHKKTFLKPVHRTAEFCSVCHKVSLPAELTQYKDFLRGQNHYDTFLLSGVSGHGARSFYYPDQAQHSCAGCHMPLVASRDFGAQHFSPTNSVPSIHDHFFLGANTGVPHLRGDTNSVRRHQEFLKDCLRVDIFGVKEGGTIDGALHAPLRPNLPVLRPGGTYLLEVVVRTLRLGHPFTQGTTDSNEIWVDASLSGAVGPVGRSGGMAGPHNSVDPWAHFMNVYMLDREGRRIDRRNAQDIFTPLYNHQIPPGAAQVAHYQFTVPPDSRGSITAEVRVLYRKFDTTYLQYVYGPGYTNDLPITCIASDRVTFTVGEGASVTAATNGIPEWQRWNDYGIGLLLEGEKGSEKGELTQAANAFKQVEKLGRPDGPLNRARVYYKEGRLDDAVAALRRAVQFNPPPPRWTVAWLNGLVNKQNGFLEQAIREFRSVLTDVDPEMLRRGLDFSKDYEVINELGQAMFERAKMERGDARSTQRHDWLRQAVEQFEKTLAIDSENLTAHYNLALIHGLLGDQARAEHHRRQHERFRPDDNARDRAIARARRDNPAADHAAQAIVIYSLQRPGAPGLPPASLLRPESEPPVPAIQSTRHP